MISAGSRHTCALTSAGAVKCWGNNEEGQLGDGSTVNRQSPVVVSGLTSGVQAVSAGGDFTCALTGNGAVHCWGANDQAQLGDGTTTRRLTPVAVSGLSSGAQAVSTNGAHSCALTGSGNAKCWGRNWVGQLGDGVGLERWTPVSVSTGHLAGTIREIRTGSEHTCVVTTAGGAKCWGYNAYGELGSGSLSPWYSDQPVSVVGLSSGVKTIEPGLYLTCALTTAGAAQCWGWNERGRLGMGSFDNLGKTFASPVPVSGLDSGVMSISAGGGHNCVLMTSGAVKCWGSNDQGQLGTGTTPSWISPVGVALLNSGVRSVSAGGAHTCALTESDTVMCWGANDSGQVGDGSTTNRLVPTAVIGL